ncbi:MAG TPA: YciI family protein [Bryobacteraceae bacterium]|jgi:hypothetical protein|nr:YciI family protein [Bryobacteraceae bacterium]
MSQFLLVLHHDPSGMAKSSPEEMQKSLEKYIAWTKKPFTLDSKRLAADPGKVIRNQGRQVTDGPYSETKEVFGGFYLIEAANYEEAVQRSMDHPHLEHGGTIEVRQLHLM